MDYNVKMLEMAKRIYNGTMLEKKDDQGKVILSDAEAIKALVDKTFTPNAEVRSIEQLRIFNKLIVETAEELAQNRVEPIISMISDYKRVGRNDVVVYEIPKRSRITMALSATGSGVDFVRIAPYMRKIAARPQTHQFGVYYNIDKMISDPVNEFRNAVNYVSDYKVKYIFNKIMTLVREAVANGTIPAGQIEEDANVDITDFRKIENKLLRYGKGVAPVFVADRELIDSLAISQAKLNLGVSGAEGILLTDELRKELLRNAEITQISRSTAIATDNPFIDDANSKVEFPINEGILLAGGSKSPFAVREFGAMRTAEGIPDIEDERVNIKIDMKLDITLLLGAAIGWIKDTAVTL